MKELNMIKKLRLLATAVAIAVPALAMAAGQLVMHRDPGCPCCSKWATMIAARFGRAVQTVDEANRAALQKRIGVPNDLSSCHTMVIGGYVIEGHVPAADIKRLLAQRPKGVKGLAVAGMPLGSPGMEVPGQRGQRYEVIAFGAAGRRVFAKY